MTSEYEFDLKIFLALRSIFNSACATYRYTKPLGSFVEGLKTHEMYIELQETNTESCNAAMECLDRLLGSTSWDEYDEHLEALNRSIENYRYPE